MTNATFSKLPHWAQGALRTAVGTASVQRGIARAQANGEVLILQMLNGSRRKMATVVQYPVAGVQAAYDKLRDEMPPNERNVYVLITPAAALTQAESDGVPYMRAFSEVPGAGAILRVPVSLWTGGDRG